MRCHSPFALLGNVAEKGADIPDFFRKNLGQNGGQFGTSSRLARKVDDDGNRFMIAMRKRVNAPNISDPVGWNSR